MAPRCVHVLAVFTALPEQAEAAPAPDVAESTPEAVDPLPLPVAEQALGALLRAGAHSADAVVRADLSRAAYEARSLGLHRLGRSLTCLVATLRLYASGHPAFTLAGLVSEFEESLLVTVQLARAGRPEWVGEARRRYAPVGMLRVWGICSEVVVSAGGSGVITWMADQRGRLWQVADVRPRAPGQALGVYDVAPPLTSHPHRALGREGLFVQDATASDDGRIGTGGGASAVRSGGSSWDAEPLRQLWSPGARALVFLEGTIVGLWRDALVIEAEQPVFVIAGSAHSSLPWSDNLRMLARMRGARVTLVGRGVPDRRRTVLGLAVTSPRLIVPDAWAGRVNLGLDRLTSAHLVGAEDEPVRLTLEIADRPDPLAPLRRRVARALLGGVETLRPDTWTEVAREAARMGTACAPGGATLLTSLATSANTGDFPLVWLAARRYLSAVDATLARESWAPRV